MKARSEDSEKIVETIARGRVKMGKTSVNST